MVVEVFIAHGDGEDPLPKQFLGRVFHFVGNAVVVKAARESFDDSGPLIDFTEQPATCVGRDRSNIKSGGDLPPTQGLKFDLAWDTICFHKTVLVVNDSVVIYRFRPAQGRLVSFSL